MYRKLWSAILVIAYTVNGFSQGCCSGGSGSPIAGGASQGVLQEHQMEISGHYQNFSSDKFFVKDRDTTPLFKKIYSNYLYGRVSYGVTKNLTVSLESGYYLNKTQLGRDTVSSSGIADLIIFPRYDIVNRTSETKRTEVTVGLGYKIPLGKHNDSTLIFTDPNTGRRYYTTSTPNVQPTNGSNDVIFYTFLYRGYPEKKFRVFANGLYMRKGWNSLGQKFGDYASVGLFAGQTFFKKLGVTLQVRGEWIAKMQVDKNVDMVALYNVYPSSTGSKKIFFSPQLSYSYRSFIMYALTEIPLYQYLNGTQVGSQYMHTAGIAYRFFVKQPE